MKKFLAKTGIKKRVISFALTGALIIFIFFISPKISIALGNVFFGRVHALYNVTLAQFFFKRAASPLFGNTPPLTHYQLSRTYFIQGEFEKAIYHADKELELYPENCRTYYIRGLTYGYMNNLDKAIEDFEAFNASCVKNSWAGHNDLAWFYFRKGDIQKMLATIEPMVTLYETNPWVQNSYGIALLNTGKYKEAAQAFQKAGIIANLMTEKDWGVAYPGNNPKIYQKGLEAMRSSILENYEIAREKALSL